MLHLDGIPLFAHSVVTALNCHKVDQVVVSSDSIEVLDLAREYGAWALERPKKLCGDDVPNFEVCRHAVETLNGKGYQIDTIALLQPTHPFRTHGGLDQAIEQFLCVEGFDSLASVKRLHRLCGEVVDSKWTATGDQNSQRAQNSKNLYSMTGHLFILNVDRTINRNSLLGDQIFAWPLPEDWLDIDIDNELDYLAAVTAIKKKNDFGSYIF